MTEDKLRAVFGAFAEDSATLKIMSLGLLPHDDSVCGTGTAAPANSPEAVAQATDQSSTRPVGWDCCAFLEFASYAEAARAYEAQRSRTRYTPSALTSLRSEGSTDVKNSAGAHQRSTSSGNAELEDKEEPETMAYLEPGELEPGEIRPSARDQAGERSSVAESHSSSPVTAGADDKKQLSSASSETSEQPLYLVEWSRLGPLRLPPMPRTAALSRHFSVMPPDFHFTSIGL